MFIRTYFEANFTEVNILVYIDERAIKNLTSKVTYNKGEEYYLKGNVLELISKKIKEDTTWEELTLIKGKVNSDSSDRSYNANVSITEYGGIINANCDCQAFSNYFPAVGICKHVVALLLKHVREEKRIIEISKGSRQIRSLLEELNIGMLANFNTKIQVKLHYVIHQKDILTNLSSLELKVGEDTLYVVKDLKEFLELTQNKDKTILFGRNFTYNPQIHVLSNEDENIISVLMEVYEVNKNLQNFDKGHNSSKLLKGKKALLADNQLKRIFNNLKGKTIEFKSNYGQSITTKISEEKLPLEFDVYEQQDHIYMKQKGQLPILLTKDGEYVLYNNVIHHIPTDKAKIFNAFYNLYDNKINNTIKFNVEDKEELGSFILPSLKEISSNINIDPTIADAFYEEPLKAALYFDKKGHGIAVEVRFNYGDVEINPLKDREIHNDNNILIREVAQELKIIQTLIECGFDKEGYRFIMAKEENMIDFIQNKIEQLSNLGEVYYSEDFKNIKIYNSPTIVSNVKINEEDLLEFDFSINEIERDELKSIFNAVKERKKFYRLKKGGFIQLDAQELQDFSSMLTYLNIKDSDLQKEKILLSTYNALYIDELLKDKQVSVKTHESFDKLVKNIKSVKHMDFKPSENLESVMRGYQKFGFKWFKTLASCGLGGILADEMGLGKTLQTIAFIESEINDMDSVPTLVIAPTSLVYNWRDEIEKFAPNLSTLIISGNKKERKAKLKEAAHYHIVITSYPLIRRDIEYYKEITFKYCFLDEAQNIKNPSSINSRSVKEVKAKAYFALTGTPIENSLTELWSIFDFIMPGYLMNHNKFLQNYEIPIVKDNDKSALQELNRHIKPFILRRLKRDVLSELPPKIEHKILVEMTKEQKKLYAAYLAQFKEELSIEIKEKGFKKSKLKILSMLTRLRQICDDPSIFIENYKGDSGKMEALLSILEESISSDHRILLFSQFTSVLKNIAKILIKEKIDYMYLDGQTKMEDRVDLVRDFNNGKSKVFLISLKAGGTGLNLTGADTVIHFDPWWNPAVEDQATDRAHRIGQKSTVEVIKLISRGTIEEKIYNLQQKKREIINNVINSDIYEEGLISELSEDEIKDLFI